VRPEDFTTVEGAGIVNGTVNFTEALGEVTLVYFKGERDEDPIIAKLLGIHQGLRGTQISLTADPSKVHMFANGKSMRP
jgi:alpha-glucoside transport system ATP-binding protein